MSIAMALWRDLALAVASSVAAQSLPHAAPFLPEDRVEFVSERPIAAVLEELTAPLMSLPGVVGVGEGRCDGKPCVTVLVVDKTEDLATRIHDIVGDETVEIVETGEIRARESDN